MEKNIEKYFGKNDKVNFEIGVTSAIKYLFDSDFENYPVKEGDLLIIRTEKDYSQKVLLDSKLEFDDPNRYFETDVGVGVSITFLTELDPL